MAIATANKEANDEARCTEKPRRHDQNEEATDYPPAGRLTGEGTDRPSLFASMRVRVETNVLWCRNGIRVRME